MSNRNFTRTFSVDQSPEAVFNAINNVRGWWSTGIEGHADKIGARFIHRALDLHRCDIEVTNLVPGKKVEWTVIDNYFSFTQDETEWKDTRIVFEITRLGNRTELHFTHIGLVPEYECYDVCRDGWTTYLNSLRELIVTGTGQPFIGEANTASEKTLARDSQARA